MLSEKYCVNCSITNVPMYMGLDGKWHCADHIGLLLPDMNEPVEQLEKEEEQA